MATYAKLLKNSNGDNILPYTRDNYVYHGDSTTDTVYSQLNTINQNLVIGHDTNNVTAQVAAASGTYTAPGNGMLVFVLPYNSTNNTIGITKDGVILCSFISVVANTQYIPFRVYSGETYALTVTGNVSYRFVPDKIN